MTLSQDEFKVFTMDAKNPPRLIRYTTAFMLLYGIQALFGVVVILFGTHLVSF